MKLSTNINYTYKKRKKIYIKGELVKETLTEESYNKSLSIKK
jgi:hypothetical protein